jgi:hypothetical protein
MEVSERETNPTDQYKYQGKKNCQQLFLTITLSLHEVDSVLLFRGRPSPLALGKNYLFSNSTFSVEDNKYFAPSVLF